MAHTPGPWEVGHLCDDSTKCNCRYIFGGGYMGGIGEVYVDNGLKLIGEGANDCPPPEEAKANLLLIAAAPLLLEALIAARVPVADYVRSCLELGCDWHPETREPMRETIHPDDLAVLDEMETTLTQIDAAIAAATVTP
jgi:hypothetical protein